MNAIPSIPLSSHQSLKECAHVIPLSCNLLGLQLKARIEGPHIALCLEPSGYKQQDRCQDRHHYQKHPSTKSQPCRALNKYFAPFVQHWRLKIRCIQVLLSTKLNFKTTKSCLNSISYFRTSNSGIWQIPHHPPI